MERKLAAILCADVAGYSRLMGDNEEATLATLTEYRAIIDTVIEQRRGRFVNSAGDSVLAEFASVINAVQCAIEIQTALKAENSKLPADRRMEFRIGVNLGDVMAEGEQIYGDGVNIAARLESLAAPGAICISGKVHSEVAGKLDLRYYDLGSQQVKNIAEPVRAWRVLLDGDATPRRETRLNQRNFWHTSLFSMAGLAIIVATFLVVQHLSLRPQPSHASIPPPQKPALALPDKPSIAVLPFINLSGDPRQDYFSDGITDYLITDLSRLPELFVIARNSSFTYKSRTVTVQQVGRELGVRGVVEGSVFKAGNRVRISVQLADAVTGANMWAARFDQPLQDIFSVQDEIVRKIVTTLNLLYKVKALELPPGRIEPTNNLDAFDYFLRGVAAEADHKTREEIQQAEKMFQKAIALDPEYADAYAQLAWTSLYALKYQYDQDPKTPERIVEFAHRAIALDNSNPWAYMVLAGVDALRRQYDQAIAEEKRAIAFDPSNPVAYFWLGDVLIFAGQPAEAIGLDQQAIRLDPRNEWLYGIDIGWANNVMGRYAQALPYLNRGAARDPDNLPVHLELAIAFAQLGRNQEARVESRTILKINPQFSIREWDSDAGPYRDQATWHRVVAALHKAGVQ
jgi:adenylate cyclase